MEVKEAKEGGRSPKRVKREEEKKEEEKYPEYHPTLKHRVDYFNQQVVESLSHNACPPVMKRKILMDVLQSLRPSENGTFADGASCIFPGPVTDLVADYYDVTSQAFEENAAAVALTYLLDHKLVNVVRGCPPAARIPGPVQRKGKPFPEPYGPTDQSITDEGPREDTAWYDLLNQPGETIPGNDKTSFNAEARYRHFGSLVHASEAMRQLYADVCFQLEPAPCTRQGTLLHAIANCNPTSDKSISLMEWRTACYAFVRALVVDGWEPREGPRDITLGAMPVVQSQRPFSVSKLSWSSSTRVLNLHDVNWRGHADVFGKVPVLPAPFDDRDSGLYKLIGIRPCPPIAYMGDAIKARALEFFASRPFLKLERPGLVLPTLDYRVGKGGKDFPPWESMTHSVLERMMEYGHVHGLDLIPAKFRELATERVAWRRAVQDILYEDTGEEDGMELEEVVEQQQKEPEGKEEKKQ